MKLLRRLPASAVLAAKLATVVFGVVTAVAAAGDACLLTDGGMDAPEFIHTQLTRLATTALAYVVTVAALCVVMLRRQRRGTLRAKLVAAPDGTPAPVSGPSPGAQLQPKSRPAGHERPKARQPASVPGALASRPQAS